MGFLIKFQESLQKTKRLQRSYWNPEREKGRELGGGEGEEGREEKGGR